MSEIDINNVLQQMRSMAELARGQELQSADKLASGVEFNQLLKNSINEVNRTQKAATELATAFETGDPSVDLSEVMVALQKASVSFQAMTQVRNNLVSAYKDIMNMPV